MTSHSDLHELGITPEVLRKFPLFARLQSDCLQEILGHLSIQEYEEGNTVIQEGQRSHGLFILIRGKLQVLKGHQSVATLHKPGEIFGELAFVRNRAHGATVRAKSPCAILKIDGSIGSNLSDRSASHFENVMFRYLTEVLADRLERTSEQSLSGEEAQTLYRL